MENSVFASAWTDTAWDTRTAALDTNETCTGKERIQGNLNGHIMIRTTVGYKDTSTIIGRIQQAIQGLLVVDRTVNVEGIAGESIISAGIIMDHILVARTETIQHGHDDIVGEVKVKGLVGIVASVPGSIVEGVETDVWLDIDTLVLPAFIITAATAA